jgi:diguanylate cyclase (GGDEF)-like protein
MQIDNNVIFNTVNNGIIILDENLKIHAWNNWLEIFTDIQEKNILGKNICDIFSYINKQKLQRKVKTVLVTGNSSFMSLDTSDYLIDIPVSNITNKIFSSMKQEITLLPYDQEKKLICIYIYDVTPMSEINHMLKEANEELIDMSHRDPLTHIYNRRYFAEESAKILAFSKRNDIPLTIIILDIDNFKKVNDTYGHFIGDEVIIKVAQSLGKHIRKSDIAARFGGEEFVMLLQKCDLKNGKLVAEKTRLDIEQASITLQNKKVIDFTISLGVAEYDQRKDTNNLELTVARADNALYQSKENGKNQTTLAH